MKLAYLFLVIAFAGCAGSAADKDIRSKVKSVSGQTGAAYDPETGIYSGSLGGTIELRDPSAK